MTLTTRAPAARPAPPARAGFTLIELLVVLAIIGIMLAILGVALQKTVEGQKVRTTKGELYKLQQSLDAEYDRVIKKCAEDQRSSTGLPQPIVAYAEGDPNRALAVWTALNLRRQFPETFAEALSPVSVVPLNGAVGFSLRAGPVPPGTVYTLQRLETFPGELQGIALPGSYPSNEESGALLYIILAKKSVSGGGAMAGAADDLSATAQRKAAFGGKELPTFADQWTNTVGFRRWYGSQTGDLAEVQGTPYVDAKNTGNIDPIDPRNLVFGWKLANTQPPQPNTTKIAEMRVFGFTGANRLATVYSLGKLKTDPTDDIFGFRLRKFGN